jgi:hypothetical protein
MTSRELAERQGIEIRHWQQSVTEEPGSDPVLNFIKKAGDVRILLDLIGRFRPVFEGAASVLELGAGQGWASCMVKRLFPAAQVVATDISEAALASPGSGSSCARSGWTAPTPPSATSSPSQATPSISCSALPPPIILVPIAAPSRRLPGCSGRVAHACTSTSRPAPRTCTRWHTGGSTASVRRCRKTYSSIGESSRSPRRAVWDAGLISIPPCSTVTPVPSCITRSGPTANPAPAAAVHRQLPVHQALVAPPE